ncbi:MAG TPA: FAD-dependent oxidoreductase [Anaerohalosphaeraceae bacterium]|mgnify:CR=1 FL=1|nr:FAD-dependent oxidoreductase [Phycisphaerae bacterium]HPO70994.1 FAD-dependent oxidoreductase [Anaerohalosphaeraceae bacterium]
MSESKRIVIIGGVAGGASAAARLRRLDETAHIVLLERGPYISFANCGLPYHIGNVIPDRNRLLVQTPEGMSSRFRIDVRTNSQALRIDRDKKEVLVANLTDGRRYLLPYDYLILSPGAEPVRPPIPGADLPEVFVLRTMSDMDAIKKAVDQQQVEQAVVVGGGYIGLEMAEALTERKVNVALVELEGQVMGTIDPEMAAPLHQELQMHGVKLYLNTSVTEICRQADGLEAVLSSGDRLAAQMVLLAVGVRPESKLAKDAGLAIGPRGGIAVNSQMQTSDPCIYAVGDAVETAEFVTGAEAVIPLAGPANRQGRIAADNICGRSSVYRRTQGTAICKVFNLAAAVTGLNEKALKRAGLPYEKVYVHPASHAGYYPGAMQMSLKLLFDPADGRILGAQAVGADGADKRIDVIATAMRAGLTVQQLQDLELCYAPPYGSAKDAVNYAGFAAANVLNGDVRLFHFSDAVNPPADALLLDVRTLPEVQAGTIPGAAHIPLDQLRSRLGELPKDKEIWAFCQVGLRGYLACRILSQHGFRCRNLSGGYKTYAAALGIRQQSRPVPQEIKSDTGQEETKPKAAESTVRIDACGLQCPGPILRLKETIDQLAAGQTVEIVSTDAGFAADIRGWCASTGSRLLELNARNGTYTARIEKQAAAGLPGADAKNKTLIVFSGDFDRAMAAFIIANGAAAMGSRVTMFFTFWGLNLLRRPQPVSVSKTLIEKMFGWMMPRGAEKTGLSRMHMLGVGTQMIKTVMKHKKVASLSELIAKAQANGVRLVACTMTMDLMGIKKQELIDGVEEGGVAMYLSQAEAAGVNLFI